MLPLLISMAMGQDCPDPASAISDATEHMLLLEDTKVAASLAQIESSFQCAWVTDDHLGSYWLLNGAIQKIDGHEARAREAFAMAQAVAPNLWLPALGPDLKALYDEEAAKARPKGALDVIHVDGYTVRIDGRVSTLPVQVIPGIHILQVGKEQVVESRLVMSIAGQGTVVDMGLSEEPGADSVVIKVGLELHTAAGLSITIGEETIANGETEPANKISVPLEGGLTLRLGPAWLRAQAAYAPLLGGQLLYLKDNEVAGAKAFIHLGGTLGFSASGFDIGALFSQTIPSRNGLRLVVARKVAGPMAVEFRGGANLHPKRAPEVAFEGLVVLRPSFF